MRLRHVFLTFLLMLSCLSAHAAPARNGMVTLSQPDGTSFRAIIRGDEFTKIKTDERGHAILQDADGWWCYAVYSNDGSKIGTGWKVGSKAPYEVLSQSSMIPYRRLSDEALRRRETATSLEPESIFRRIGIQTKSGAEEPVVKHGIVILAAFQDVGFRYTKDDFDRLLNEEGYTVNGAVGSAKEYFDDQFNGNVLFDFQVSSIVTLPKNRAYYGANGKDDSDQAPAEMVRDACLLADDEIDFRSYDDDNDGTVDNVFIFFAGVDEAEGGADECIWSHAWYIESGAGITLELDEKKIDRYACSSELSLHYDTNGKTTEYISSIGTFCHEYSHTFGLPDFYDTDYEESGGISAGLWNRTSLMDGGNFNNHGNTPPYYNAIERMILGIVEPVELSASGTYRLEPLHSGGFPYMISSSTGDEIFLFECRTRHKWDENIGGSGMLVYHIDIRNEVQRKWNINEVNADPSLQCADLIEADGRADKFASTDEYKTALQRVTGVFFPYNEIVSMNTEGTPKLSFRNGEVRNVTLTDIRKSDEHVQFTFLGEDGANIPPTATNIKKSVYPIAAIIDFESSHEYDKEATLVWGRSGASVKDTLTLSPYSTGRYAALLEGLEPGGKTYEIDIFFKNGTLQGETRSTSVMTGRMPSVVAPLIVTSVPGRNTDNTFPAGTRLPLLIYGAQDTEEIKWYFNDMPIVREGDMQYTLKSGGTLKAVICYSDGSTDIICKEIIISE